MTAQGQYYADFIAAQLKDEFERRDWLNDAAISLVTRSTGLLTLVIAALAFLVGKTGNVPGLVEVCVVVAVIALLTSACLAVYLTLDYKFLIATTGTMRSMLTSHWNDSESRALHATAHCNLKTIETLRPGTRRKSRILKASGGCQVLAVLALAVCALAVVINH